MFHYARHQEFPAGLGNESPQGSEPIMQSRSNNIIPLNDKSAQHGFLEDVSDQLNQLTTEHIHPALDSLIPYLTDKIEAQLEQTTSNHEIMIKMEMKNALLKNSSDITSQFKELSSSYYPSVPENEDTGNLILLDNIDLDHKLVWMTAADKMSDKDNIQQLFRIKNRFEHAFPDFKDQIPATPEKLCESFSIAIDIIHPEDSFKQQLFFWFIEFIKERADALWSEADLLLEDIGLELNISTKTPDNHNNQAAFSPSFSSNQGTGNPNTHHSITQGPEDPSPAFMDSLADRLVTHVENMLIRDELIPESKKYQVRTLDLAGILATLQMEIMQQHASITNLTESIQSALDRRGEISKLSPRHEDLINLVGMLFEYILDDHMLPENVRKSISLLQIPVLRTAILDYDFLTERHHPARILLNEMTSAGMECKDNCFTDPVYLLIDGIVHLIISQSHENPEIFKDCLEKFRVELGIINQPHNEQKPDIDNKEEVESHALEDAEATPHKEDEGEIILEEAEFDEAEEIILESSTPAPLLICENETISDDAIDTIPPPSTPDDSNSIQEEAFAPIEGLKIGQWVEFVGEGEQHRLNCKLAHIDSHTNRYIFENRSGMKVAECDGKQLITGIENGSIIIQNDIQIFERALQAVFEKFKKL